MSDHEPIVAPDETPVWGVKAIAAIVGLRPKQVYYLLESNALPAMKVGGRWAALPSRLRNVFTVDRGAA